MGLLIYAFPRPYMYRLALVSSLSQIAGDRSLALLQEWFYHNGITV